MLTTNDKEDIHIGYITALCASVGISFDLQRHDGDSTDGIIKKIITWNDGSKFLASLRIQLKCTSSESLYKDNGQTITYKLKAKNYNDLCTKSTTPIILGLLVLKGDESDWVKWTPDDLLINGCMYWTELSKETPTNNESTVSIKIDKNNILNKDTLLVILNRIAEGDWP